VRAPTPAPAGGGAFVPYRASFLSEVEANVEEGRWVKMCMQCGVCAGSCPFGPHWQHSPQKLFMMIRAGQREAVLATDSMWMCTSCYNCVVRCPRKLPITTIMHGIAAYAHKLGLAPKMQPTRDFSLQFWSNCTRGGRINELKLTVDLYFRDGLIAGIKKGWSMRGVALGLLKAKRLNPFELFAGHRCKDRKGIAAMLAKARQIEQRGNVRRPRESGDPGASGQDAGFPLARE
jgi:quinone-modifying oxidoreductase subunit QmoC